MTISKGIIYIATGEKFYNEALTSASSVKQFNKTSICIFTDRTVVDTIFDKHIILTEPEFSMLDKVKNIWKTPYNRTLYLDTDTYITGNLDAIFDSLDYVDFMASIECSRGFWYQDKISIPYPLPEFNGGVLAFNNSNEVIQTLMGWYAAQKKSQLWLKNHLNDKWTLDAGKEKWMITLDQPSLREIIWKNKNIRVANLSDEYNALVFSGTRLWGPALIVHGRGAISKYAKQMNSNKWDNRTYFQGCGTLRPFNEISFLESIGQIYRIIKLTFYLKLKKIFKL